ncbi:putative maleylacetoacetate isomerase 2 [Gonapodya prolifera JEL478]|uniref:Putative maleylacetoacetate isomerase 2 n=1 Tax=Gonapodya prolifera (strain JEL478) TaxID=1344416 RepID=A0A139A0J1_GONPJ|nr:putative maleylacetoacetate isomerase 2 [Gonapodya prolifera JEL478]|eukprot:KXS10055.1 putative maleylacetoacetate isomerase 2 [Gonapodya prolifera JEL478]
MSSSSQDQQILLYGYFRSTAAWRVRLALTLKGIPFDQKFINLVKGEQNEPSYKEINPNRVLPSLVISTTSSAAAASSSPSRHVLNQSPAILEFIEEYFPDHGPKLLPNDLFERQQVRSIVSLVCCDIHPVQNLRVQVKLFGKDAAAREDYAKWAIGIGFDALELTLEKTAGKYCVGDTLSLADLCVVPMAFNAYRNNVSMDVYPTIARIYRECHQLEAFRSCHPKKQPDCPAEGKVGDETAGLVW